MIHSIPKKFHPKRRNNRTPNLNHTPRRSSNSNHFQRNPSIYHKSDEISTIRQRREIQDSEGERRDAEVGAEVGVKLGSVGGEGVLGSTENG